MIEVDSLTKKFESTTVLDRLSLDAAEGEIVAILGANGVGKTTLLKCLVGLLAPLEGTITIRGLDRQRDHLAIRRFTAWLADQPFLYSHFTGRQWLRMVADLYAVPPERRDLQIEELLRIFALDEIADKKIAFYSNGQYKKLALCAMFASNCELLVMDEPFTGEIDPPGVAALRRLLVELRRRGRTAVFSTQMVREAEELADRIAILDRGRIRVFGPLEQLLESFGVDSLENVVSAIVARPPEETTRVFLTTLDG